MYTHLHLDLFVPIQKYAMRYVHVLSHKPMIHINERQSVIFLIIILSLENIVKEKT